MMTVVPLEVLQNFQKTIELMKLNTAPICDIVLIVDFGQELNIYTTAEPDMTDDILGDAVIQHAAKPRGVLPSPEVDKE